MRDAETENGGRSSSSSEGTSVARDREARLSMIRFTHSICTAVRGLSWLATAPVQAVATATIFTTSCTPEHNIVNRMTSAGFRVSDCVPYSQPLLTGLPLSLTSTTSRPESQV